MRNGAIASNRIGVAPVDIPWSTCPGLSQSPCNDGASSPRAEQACDRCPAGASLIRGTERTADPSPRTETERARLAQTMIRLAASRLLQSMLVLLAMSFVIYALIGLMPGDPIDLMISPPPAVVRRRRTAAKIHGLDRTLTDRYAAWLGAALTGDFGYSRLQSRPVLDALLPALNNTIILMSLALVLALAVALPAGILAAVRRHTWIDQTVSLASFLGISTPSFWTALLLIIVFAVVLGWLPAGGSGASVDAGILQRVPFLVLPVISLTLAALGGYLRYARVSMIETLNVRSGSAPRAPRG